MRNVGFRHLVAVLLVLSCGDEGLAPAATPTSIASDTQAPTAVVGLALTPTPSFSVRGGNGQPLAGIAITVSVVEGGGTLIGAPTRTTVGATSVGQWILGTRAGRNTLQVKVEGLSPLSIVATGIAGPPSQILSVSGNGRRALAGTTMTEPLVLQVADQFGNPVAGERVNLTLDAGGATLVPAQVTSDAQGATAPAAWRLGLKRRQVTGRATLASNPVVATTLRAEFQSDYHIDVRFAGTASDAIRQAFESAADRIAGVIIGDVPDQFLANFDPSRCGGPAGAVSETVDDVVIYAEVSDIDGPGKVLGRAGPCVTRSTSRHTVVGLMQFDVADAQNLLASGRFEAVVMHEMLHVIGVGSLWRSKNLLEGDVAVDPRFIGARGTEGCLTIGFAAACAVGSVPVENSGGSGTAGSHWRESVFDAELMTGFAEASATMPLSALTIGSLEDFGYSVHAGAADPFAAPAALARRPAVDTPAPPAAMDVVLAPRFEVLPAGWLRPWR
jgi:Leishmanolysin